MNMEYWMAEQITMQDKKLIPLISYPSVQLMFINIERLVRDSRAQASMMFPTDQTFLNINLR